MALQCNRITAMVAATNSNNERKRLYVYISPPAIGEMQYWPSLEVKCTDIIRITNIINIVIIENQCTILFTFQNVIANNIKKLLYLYRF